MTRSADTPSDASTMTVDLGGRERAPNEPELVVGTAVGRYVVVERVGQGGMARVVRAYDPRLRREVALKLLRAIGDEQAHARIVREPQAMARLSHPNVVAVYDVDEHDGCPFIAMEYVEGQTLQEWLRDAPRATDAIVQAFVAAGRGLAAAHAMGIVHRDVKLANILRGHDGRVRVTDFGIARTLEDITPDSRESSSAGDSSDAALTQTGTVFGTPPYMAPEQHQGLPADARSDQYGFCISLWEAVAGARPFAGADMRALYAAKRELQTTAPERPIPGWLRSLLLRGLAPAPADRFPTMDDLLAALSRGRTRQRLRRAGVAIGLVGLGAAGIWGAGEWDRQRRASACADEGDAIDEVWSSARRDELRAALLATGVPYAAATTERVTPWLDEHAESWRAEATAACMDARVHRRWDEDMLARAHWCLDERRLELDAVVGELLRGDAKVLDRAVQAAAGLSRVEPCRDAELLARLPAPPQDRREEIAAVRREVARASAMELSGDFAGQLAVAQDARAAAQNLGWPPLVAAARVQLGDAQQNSDAYDDARTELETAYFEAMRSGALDEAFAAAQQLAFLAAYRQAKHDIAIRWSRHAELLLQELPDHLRTREQHHLSGLGVIQHIAGSYDEAKRLHARALAIAEEQLPPDHPAIAEILANLAIDHGSLGEFAEAKAMHQRVLAIRERLLGPDHPYLADTLNNLAAVDYMTGDYAQAKASFERALALNEAAHGPDHTDVASNLVNLGTLHYALGEFEPARAAYERALAIKISHHGPDHTDVAQVLNNLALVDWSTKSYDAAEERSRRAMAIWETSHGPDHPEIAYNLNTLANVAAERGRYDEASAAQRRALAILEKAVGPDHVRVSLPLQGLATIALAQHRWGEAAQYAQRALELRERASAGTDQTAEARFALARALAGSGREPDRANELARRAREEYAASGAAYSPMLTEIDAFLREHGARR